LLLVPDFLIGDALARAVTVEDEGGAATGGTVVGVDKAGAGETSDFAASQTHPFFMSMHF
jgi:hypothetical protein